MPTDEMDDPVMRPAKPVLLEDRVGLGGEIALGEKQQFDALPHLLLAQEDGLGRGGRRRRFYVSHVDLLRNL